jgi:primosomal replication protein N
MALGALLLALLIVSIASQTTGPHRPPRGIPHDAVLRYRAAMHVVQSARQALITIANRLAV